MAVGVIELVAILVAVSVAGSVAGGVAGGVAGSVAGGVAVGMAVGMMVGMAFPISYFRLFLLPFEAFTTLWALFRARRQPQQAARFIRQSLAYWDEAMMLPQPFLTSLLVLVGEQDREAGMAAITHLVTNTFQKRVAVNALLELGGRDLLHRQTAEEIAQLAQSPGWLSPDAATGTGTGGTFQKRQVTEAHQRCLQIGANVSAALSATSNYQKQLALNRTRRQLDELRHFAVMGLRGRESRLFAQVAQQWLNAVNAEIDRLTEEERVAQRIQNPYVAPGPLSPDTGAVFVGRTQAFRFVEEYFLRAGQNTPIVLHGQPRIGKTSILRYFPAHLSTNLIPVYVDMQRAAQVESTSGLLFNLADAIGQELARRGMSLPVPSLDDYATEPFIVFGKFLDAVENALRTDFGSEATIEPSHSQMENRLVLALDEFEGIERKLTEGKVSEDLMPFLRNMMQHRQGIALLFAGTHTLDEMVQKYWIPYFRSAVPCKVSYLNEEEARKLITNPIEEFLLDYEPEAVEQLMAVTHRHPCLIQLACSALVDLKNEQRSRYASVEDVEQALAKVLETGDYVFRGVWDWIPPHERKGLSELASKGRATVEQLARSLRTPVEQVQRMVNRLIEAEVVEMSTVGGGEPACQFQVELVRRWVEQHAARTEVGAKPMTN